MREGCVRQEALSILHEARSKSRFLFGDEIDKYFESMWEKAAQMHKLRSQIYSPDGLASMPGGPERRAICEEETKLLSEMMDEMASSPKQYNRYLQFK